MKFYPKSDGNKSKQKIKKNHFAEEVKCTEAESIRLLLHTSLETVLRVKCFHLSFIAGILSSSKLALTKHRFPLLLPQSYTEKPFKQKHSALFLYILLDYRNLPL